jgi:hypothetical protein
MISWEFVPAHALIEELKPVIDRHHSEVAEDNEPLNIDWDLYDKASRAGMAVAITARDGGKLVGYIIFTVSRNLRHMHLIEATSSGWYVEPEYRGRIGSLIIKKSREFLKTAGVNKTKFILGGKAALLLERLGYSSKHQVWELDNGK